MTKFSFYFYIILFFFIGACQKSDKEKLAGEFEKSIKNNILKPWYPKAIDELNFSFLSSFDKDFNPAGTQDKFIHSQAKHVWITSDASIADPVFKKYAQSGFRYLAQHMWDSEKGGFYELLDQSGHPKGDSLKSSEGNAYGILAAAHYFKMCQDTAALNLAIRAFNWLDVHAHDETHKGYFAHVDRGGKPVIRTESISLASEQDYKSFVSSIQILEALSELYQIWGNPVVKSRIDEMYVLLRDTMVDDQGNVLHFFKQDWTAISYKDSSKQTQMNYQHLDYVSFGDNLLAAKILLETSGILGLPKDSILEKKAKRLIDQSIRQGMDAVVGGFYDQAIYFNGQNGMSISQGTKSWAVQARALSALLVASIYFPNDSGAYYAAFLKQWKYINDHLIDHKNGDWFDSGLDKDPYASIRPKGTLVKNGYEQYKSLKNSLNLIR